MFLTSNKYLTSKTCFEVKVLFLRPKEIDVKKHFLTSTNFVTSRKFLTAKKWFDAKNEIDVKQMLHIKKMFGRQKKLHVQNDQNKMDHRQMFGSPSSKKFFESNEPPPRSELGARFAVLCFSCSALCSVLSSSALRAYLKSKSRSVSRNVSKQKQISFEAVF